MSEILTPQDRIKRSLERLDVPDWYSTRQREGGTNTWKRGSQTECEHQRVASTSAKSKQRNRSLPPPSPSMNSAQSRFRFVSLKI